MEDHLVGCVTVPWWVEVVEAMGQDGYSVHVVGQSVAVRMDINTVCQSADNQCVWTQPAQVCEEVTDEILSIGGAVACADHRDDIVPTTAMTCCRLRSAIPL